MMCLIIIFYIGFLQAGHTKMADQTSMSGIIPLNDNFKSNDRIAPNVATFASTAALRSFEEGVENTWYFLMEKGKEGYFFYDPSDQTSADNEGTVIVSIKGKRYKRVFEGELTITWFGAKGDGITDDTQAFVKAISANSNSIYLPYKAGGYKVANITITKTITLRGDNKFNSKIIPARNGVSCFITGNEFVEYRDLYFDGAGTSNTIGIEHKHRISTVSNCFFSGLKNGIFNNKLYVQGGKPDEQTIDKCRFRNCEIGIFSNGHFINSKITNSTFHGCTRSAIYCTDESFAASTSTTEGLVVEGCLIYSSGSKLQNTAAIDLSNVDFSFVRNCMVDINTHTALSLKNSQNCSVSGSYFSSAAAGETSIVRVLGNCSNTSFNDCRFYDSKGWGMEISPLSGRLSNNVRISNCLANLNAKGDLITDGATNVWITNCAFMSNTSSVIYADNSKGTTSVYIRSSNVAGQIIKAGSSVVLTLKDCPTNPTTTFGTVRLLKGQRSLLFPHGLTVLKGQKAYIVAVTSSMHENLSAKILGDKVQIIRDDDRIDSEVTYKIEVN